MFGFLAKIFRPRKRRREEAPDPDDVIEEQWTADFTRPNLARFDLKSESAYDAYLRKDCLVLGLRKSNCIVWAEDPLFRYRDQLVRGRFRLDAGGAYAAAGFMFRVVDERTYYSVLISNKGYFRLDVLRNGMPFPLIGWTEIPSGESPDSGIPGSAFELTAAAYGSHILLVINGRWAAEINDPSIGEGRVCFTAACYDAPAVPEGEDRYTAEASLEAFSVDSRITQTGEFYEQWQEKAAPLSRFRLAETFAAMGQPVPALVQLKKVWEAAAPERGRTQKELLLAARLSMELNLLDEAGEYAAACIAAGAGTPEGREAAVERAKLLYSEKKFEELIPFAEAALAGEDSPVRGSTLYTLLGHGYFNRKDYENAAASYDKAFSRDRKNGLLAKNAANAYEFLDRRPEALDRYLEAGRAFLAEDNYRDLGLLIPKLQSLGAENREARGLAGKWAFGVENWAMAREEFALEEKLRPAGAPKDPALVFLRALLLVREGKRREALPLMKEAADLAPDYALFRFRLAENRFILSGIGDPELMTDLETAMTLAAKEEDAAAESAGDIPAGKKTGTCGWTANLAAQIALVRGDLEEASRYLNKAVRVLGEIPAIRVNRGALYYLQGSLDKGLAVLESGRDEDPEGLMSNCAGNLLVRAKRYEEADAYYRNALTIAPDNIEYLRNRASCLIELGQYGGADELLSRAHAKAPSPAILELIAYVAAKKGEYQRAEAACNSALEMESRHVPSLLSLGWIYSILGRWDETEGIIRRLDELALNQEDGARREELRGRLEDARTRLISCVSCSRNWRVPRTPPPAPPLKLFAMPPDDLPAGTCPQCGGTYCIGCGKTSLDKDGRFLCPKCGKSLKLSDEGLKKLIYDWAAEAIPPRK